MRVYLVKLPFGHVAVDEGGKVVALKLAPRDPKLALEFFLSEPKLELPKNAEIVSGEKAYEFVRKFSRKLALESGFVKDEVEYLSLIHI